MFNSTVLSCLLSTLVTQAPHPLVEQPKTKTDYIIENEAKERISSQNWKEGVNIKSNQEKFSALRQFNLPTNEYAITGSGPLGIRNLKTIGDIDIIVTQELWDRLAREYGITDQNGVRKIVFPGGVVEAFQEGSFYKEPFDNQAPSITSRIANAEIIDGLPFDSMEIILYYKCKAPREKDLKDIRLIEEWMKVNNKKRELDS